MRIKDYYKNNLTNEPTFTYYDYLKYKHLVMQQYYIMSKALLMERTKDNEQIADYIEKIR